MATSFFICLGIIILILAIIFSNKIKDLNNKNSQLNKDLEQLKDSFSKKNEENAKYIADVEERNSTITASLSAEISKYKKKVEELEKK